MQFIYNALASITRAFYLTISLYIIDKQRFAKNYCNVSLFWKVKEAAFDRQPLFIHIRRQN